MIEALAEFNMKYTGSELLPYVNKRIKETEAKISYLAGEKNDTSYDSDKLEDLEMKVEDEKVFLDDLLVIENWCRKTPDREYTLTVCTAGLLKLGRPL